MAFGPETPETPIRPEEVVTSDAPVSRLSGAEVAQPYEELARGLDKAGEGLEAVAEPLAQMSGSHLAEERMNVPAISGLLVSAASNRGPLPVGMQVAQYHKRRLTDD